MQIEVGKYYRTREGWKVGPMKWSNKGKNFATAQGYADDHWYTQYNLHHKGKSGRTSIYNTSCDDLIDEWEEGPVRTVTSKEIVPGEYGAVWVLQENLVSCGYMRTPGQLREAAATLIEIADALDENND